MGSIAKEQIESGRKLLQGQWELVRLLNGLTDERSQWKVAFGRQDYIDVFGDLIPKGRDHYRQGSPLNDGCLRLSARSMDGVLRVALSNQHAINLAKRVTSQRDNELRKFGAAISRGPDLAACPR